MSFFRRNRDEEDDDVEEKEAPSSGSPSRPFSSSRLDTRSSTGGRGESDSSGSPFRSSSSNNIFDRAGKKEDDSEDDSSSRLSRFGSRSPSQRNEEGQGERRGFSSPASGSGSGFRRPEERDSASGGDRPRFTAPGTAPLRRDEEGQGERRGFSSPTSGSGSGFRRPEERDSAPGGDRPRFTAPGASRRDEEGQGSASGRRSFSSPASGSGGSSFRRPEERDSAPGGDRPRFTAPGSGFQRPGGAASDRKDDSKADAKKEDAGSSGSRFSLGGLRRGGDTEKKDSSAGRRPPSARDAKKEDAGSSGSRFSLGGLRRGGDTEKKDSSAGRRPPSARDAKKEDAGSSGSRFSLGGLRRGGDTEKKDSSAGRRPPSARDAKKEDAGSSGSRFSLGGLRRGGDTEKKDSPVPGRRPPSARDAKKEDAGSSGSRFGLGGMRRSGDTEKKEDARPAVSTSAASRPSTLGGARPAISPTKPPSQRGTAKPLGGTSSRAKPASKRGSSKPLPSKTSKRVNIKNSGLTLDQKLDLLGLGLLGVALLLLSGLVSSGSFVDPLDNFLAQLFGVGRVVIPVFAAIVGIWLLAARFGNEIEIEYLRIAGVIILFVTLLTSLQWYTLFFNPVPSPSSEIQTQVGYQSWKPESPIGYISYPTWNDLELASQETWQAGEGGGVVGHTIYFTLARQLGDWGVVFVGFLFWVIALMLAAQTTTSDVADQMRNVRHSLAVRREAKAARKEAKRAEKEAPAIPAVVAAAAVAAAEAPPQTGIPARPSVTEVGLNAGEEAEQPGKRAPREGGFLSRRVATPEEDKATVESTAPPTRAPVQAAVDANGDEKKSRWGRRLIGGRVKAEKIEDGEAKEGQDAPESAEEKRSGRSFFGRFGRKSAEAQEPAVEGQDIKAASGEIESGTGEASTGRFSRLGSALPGRRKSSEELGADEAKAEKTGRFVGLRRSSDEKEPAAAEETKAASGSRFGLRRAPKEDTQPAEGRRTPSTETAEDGEKSGSRLGTFGRRLPFAAQPETEAKPAPEPLSEETKPADAVEETAALSPSSFTASPAAPSETPEKDDLKVAASSTGAASIIARNIELEAEKVPETSADEAEKSVELPPRRFSQFTQRDPEATQVNQATSPFGRLRASTDAEAPGGRFSQLRRAAPEEKPADSEAASTETEQVGDLFGRRAFRSPRDGERSESGRFGQFRRAVPDEKPAESEAQTEKTDPGDALFNRVSDEAETTNSGDTLFNRITEAAEPETTNLGDALFSPVEEAETTNSGDTLFNRVNEAAESVPEITGSSDTSEAETEKPAVPVGRFNQLLARREPKPEHADPLANLRAGMEEETDISSKADEAPGEDIPTEVVSESAIQAESQPENDSDSEAAEMFPAETTAAIDPEFSRDRLREVIRNRGWLDESTDDTDESESSEPAQEAPAKPRGLFSSRLTELPQVEPEVIQPQIIQPASAEILTVPAETVLDERLTEEPIAAAENPVVEEIQPAVEVVTPAPPPRAVDTPARVTPAPNRTVEQRQPERQVVQAQEARPQPAAPQRIEWKLPEYMGLLEAGSEQDIDQYFLLEQARIIEDTLASFGAPGKVVEVNSGPVITQFGVEPDYLEKRGGRTRVKVSAIAALDKDIALALAAKSIRIEAPVPGKGFVGIEVPNAEPAVVSLRDVMSSDEHQHMVRKSPLTIGLGQSVDGTPVSANLTQMPHLLIAGTTGSGKSVCVNAIISCLLLQNTPDDLQMIMVDPKRVELTGYNGIPHLISNVVVDLERIIGVLKWVQREMDERYKKLNERSARNIEDYNRKLTEGMSKIPYLVVVIDELADLMMLAPDETEKLIARLAQMARATGIHLIISTQRPSVDVVTGLIKANFPARIAFAVASSVDSRVILDSPGADRLLGKGDMLYQAPDASAPVRMQGVFVSDPELDRITRYWKEMAISAKRGGSAAALPKPHEPSLPEAQMPVARSERFDIERPPAPTNQKSFWAEVDELAAESRIGSDDSGGDEDDMFDEAVEVVRSLEKASVSLLQRRLRIGYTRAARLIDMMEERGIIGPAESGSKPRRVIAGQDEDDS